MAVTFWTGNTHLVPTQRIFTAFVCGGAVGMLGASVLEVEFLKQPLGLTSSASG